MATRKKILFEGQDVSLSSTMQKLQSKAEEASSKLLENYSKVGKSSKDLVKMMQEEIKASQRLSSLSASDQRYQAAERYSKRLEEINQLEEKHNELLKTKGLNKWQLEEQQAKASKTFDQMREGASITNDERLKLISEQTEEQKKTNELLKQILEVDKTQWEQEVRQDRTVAERFVEQIDKTGTEGMSAEEKAKYAYQKSLLQETAPKEERKQSVLKDIIGAGIIRDLGGVLGQMPNASDAYDLVPALTRMGGAALGGGAGGLIGFGAGALQTGLGGTAAGRGAMEGVAIGGEFGQRAGEIAGSALSRFFTERENLESASYRAQAITGLSGNRFEGMGSFNKFGSSRADAFGIYSQMAGSSGSVYNDVGAMLGAETGYGIDRGSLMGMTGSSRITGGQFGNEIRNLIGTAEKEGIDRVLFNDLVQGQTQLINSIGSMTEKVDPKNIMAVQMEMNKLGGAFSLKDPRSTGLIQSIDAGLKGGNDFHNAMDLSILRKMMPNASLLDMLEVKEQGLGTEKGREFLKETITGHKEMYGGNEEQTILSLRQRFPKVPINALRRLVRGEGIIDSIDTEKMDAQADITEQGNVSRRAIMRSEVTDAFAIGAIEGMTKINDQMADLFAKAYEKAMEQVDIAGWIKGKTEPKAAPKKLGNYNFGKRTIEWE